jgi:DNA-binding LytR/AlgR family response regulator
MNVLLIEDEVLAVQQLTRLLKEVGPHIRIIGQTDGIESSVEWLNSHAMPDLILMDIELSDGQSFEIFNRVDVPCPVIFTTSYDEYAIRAFQVNSVDYLLKPVKPDDLVRALKKYERLNRPAAFPLNLSQLFGELQRHNQSLNYRTRFLVKQGQRLLPIDIERIAYFCTEDGLTVFFTHEGTKYVVDYTLEELEAMLDPKVFFRATRQVILSIHSVGAIHTHFNGKLKLHLVPASDKEVFVSRERVNAFKDWLGR